MPTYLWVNYLIQFETDKLGLDGGLSPPNTPVTQSKHQLANKKQIHLTVILSVAINEILRFFWGYIMLNSIFLKIQINGQNSGGSQHHTVFWWPTEKQYVLLVLKLSKPRKKWFPALCVCDKSYVRGFPTTFTLGP